VNEPELPAGRKVTIMSTTISTHQSHHVPLFATLAVGGVIAAAGLIGVAVHESSSGTTDSPPAVTQPRAADQNATVADRLAQQHRGTGQYQHYYSGQQLGGDHFHPTTSGGKTVDAP
jgi:hypothetical protein